MIRLNNYAFDHASFFYMKNSKFINSDRDSIVRFDMPDTNTIGWLGGCGPIGVCTGVENY